MLSFSAWLASLLYLIPPVALLAARSRRDRALWEIALDIPVAVAADLAVLMLLARVMTLEWAVLISRPLWVIGAAVWMVRQRRRKILAWPRDVGRRELYAVALTVVVSVLLSVAFSRDCLSFDRGWHIPLSASIRGQTLPFANVYAPGKALSYHFAGDLQAATLQTLSGLFIHSSLALALGHDLAFGLTAAMLALLIFWLGLRSPVPVAVLAQAPLLAGPATLLVARHRLNAGYNFITLYKLGFRPHTALALLFIMGFLGAVLVRLRLSSAPPPARYTALVLVACTAILAVTDEASIGLLGICLGATWLVFPNAVAERRKQGVVVLAALLGTVLLASVAFHGVLVGGLKQSMAWVPGRSPGYYRPPLSLDTSKGRLVLFRDLLPSLGIWFGCVVALLRDRSAERAAAALFLTLLFGLSVLALTHVDLGQRSVESHRFMTVALVALPVGAFLFLFPRRGSFGLAETLVLAGMTLAAISSLDWLAREGYRGAGQCAPPSLYFARQDLFNVNCRRFAGAHFGQRPKPIYLDKPIAYAVAGCRPVFTSGPPPSRVRSDRIDLASHPLVRQWGVKIGRMLFDRTALRDVDKNLTPPDQPLDLACARPSNDPVCTYAQGSGFCHPVGKIDECLIPPGDRRAAVAHSR